MRSAETSEASPIPERAGTSNLGVAVVELFTSEGCSSCPAADAAVARVAAVAERRGSPVFTVELHVDYWDYLGWRDPFDDVRFSERQARYRALSGSTYTPQVVVNGVKETVGSDQARLNELISSALADRASTRLMLTADWSGGSVLVHCQGEGIEPAQTLNLFVLENRVESGVTRGENAGERLQHHNVARAFDSRRVPGGHFEVTWQAHLPGDLGREGLNVLAFTERTPQAGVTGASLTVPK